MLTYRRISNINGVMRYEFYPQGNTSAPGIVEFETGKNPKLIQESEADFKRYYANHALNGIDTLRDTGTVAWY